MPTISRVGDRGVPTSNDLAWLISVDDHVLEPPHVWQTRVPKALRDRAPKIQRVDGAESWVFDGAAYPTAGLATVAGKSPDQFRTGPITYDEMRPGCYDSTARVEDMNAAGILASLCFPSFPRFCGQLLSATPDRELSLACVVAYNDWIIEEWCGSAPGRFIPLIVVPMWDPLLAAREILRCADNGAKAIAFSENPSRLGYPSIHDANRYWDPVFAAADETGLPLCIHIGSSSTVPMTSSDTPFIESVALQPMECINTAADWLFSGNLLRFDHLKICLSEGGIGWIPYILERFDYTFERQKGWALDTEVKFDGTVSTSTRASQHRLSADRLPSALFLEHIFGCFIDDQHGIDSLDSTWEDNVMIETDYPHSDSTWPNSLALAHQRLWAQSDEVKYKVLQGNARRVFRFDPASPPKL